MSEALSDGDESVPGSAGVCVELGALGAVNVRSSPGCDSGDSVRVMTDSSCSRVDVWREMSG